MGIYSKNPDICDISNQQAKQKPSQYKCVTYDKETCKWNVLIYVKGQKQKYGGQFNDELDAAKRVNQLCEELGIPQKNTTVSAMPNQEQRKKGKISKYKGVFWHNQREKWYVVLYVSKEQSQKYGGRFNDELDAAKKVNQLCEDFGIPQQNPELSAIPNEQSQKKEKISQYKGVTWHKQRKKWYAQVTDRQVWVKKQKQKYGGYFNEEIDAAKRVNQLCEEMEIPLLNPTTNAIPNQQQAKEQTSQYKGVYYHKQKRKWCARIYTKEKKQQNVGMFKDELDAISTTTSQQYKKKQKTSQYKGVNWQKEKGKWYVQVQKKGQKKTGGYFYDELDAAKRANQLCEELKIPQYNPTISMVPNQECQHDDYQTANLFDSEILETDHENAKKKKRKRPNQINDDNKLPVETYYFYDTNLLK